MLHHQVNPSYLGVRYQRSDICKRFNRYNPLLMGIIKKWVKRFLEKREAEPHSAPYIVSIQVTTTPDGPPLHYCAGTIINEHWILTAAHCLSSSRQTVDNSIIVAGCHDICSTDRTATSRTLQCRTIDYYVQHELYLGGVNPYDIALIYTETPLQFTDYVQPVKLPEADAMPKGCGTLYGWGNVSIIASRPLYPSKLQKVNMPILDLELCEKILGATGAGRQLHETNLCTGPLTGGVSICTADSGGPLIQRMSNELVGGDDDSDTIIGVVSWGRKPCGQKNTPSVFVRVSAFVNWIEQVMTSDMR